MNNEMVIDYEFLLDNGEKIGSAYEGTCILYSYNQQEYVVLSDNTVITREEDNRWGPNEAIFPYKRN